MSRPYMELPEAVDRVIRCLRVYDDPPYGREVYIAFDDGTQISIDLAVETSVHAKHYRGDKGDLEILHEHQDPAPVKG
ncbi:MAG: hypothetical protein WBQ94_13910 [Terracidiphilus sp.]